MSTLPVVVMHTDGACSGNPGPGGWAAILVHGEHVKELSGGLVATTNNRAELLAVLNGLQALKVPCAVEVVTDSQNVIGWLRLGWKRRDPEIRKLCAKIDKLIEEKAPTILFRKVKGHSGEPMNERADQLAQAAIPA
jgi:ribonuclease HI